MYICLWLCLHTHRYLLCAHILETPAILPWLREQSSPNRTQLSLVPRISPQGSLASSHAPRSLVLRGWRAESGPIPETAEKHKKGLLFWLLPRIWYPGSEYPTPLPWPQPVPKISPGILVDKDGLTKRKWSSSFFLSFFLLCNHASVSPVLSPQRRCGCWILRLPPTALWSSHRGQCLDSTEELQEFQPSHSVVSQTSDASSSVVLKSP